jgi:CubicO group peptidase (beta-lactamase class C family)
VRDNIPSISVAVQHDQTLLFAGAFGCADIQAGIPATPETVYRAGSITKLFTDTMLMQLRDEGRAHRCDTPPPAPTLLELATHRSGLPRDPQPRPESVAHLFQMMGRSAADDDDTVEYSNFGLAVLGQALAVAAGQPYAEYVETRILQPLGMTASGFREGPLAGRIATGYRDTGGVGPVVPGWTSGGAAGVMAPAGALYTTPADLMKFAALQFRQGAAGGSQVLSGASLREMQSPHFPTSSGGQIGVGWFIGRIAGETVIMHNGRVEGFRADLKVVPDLKLAAAVMFNVSANRQGLTGPEQVDRMILETLIPLVSQATRG